jgi:hypothetical protein
MRKSVKLYTLKKSFLIKYSTVFQKIFLLPSFGPNDVLLRSVAVPNPDPDPRVLGLLDPDPDPLVRGIETDLDPNPSVI